jgi:hypothetical protein
MERQRLEPVNTSITKKRDPRGGVLDKKMKWMKLKENVIITSKLVYRKKVFIGLWSMQYVT